MKLYFIIIIQSFSVGNDKGLKITLLSHQRSAASMGTNICTRVFYVLFLMTSVTDSHTSQALVATQGYTDINVDG